MLRDRNKAGASDASTTALRVLAFLLSQENYRDGFLAQCGVAPQDLQEMARDQAFLAGVLDMLLQDESMLLAFCAESGLKPGQVTQAARALSPAADG